jgi:hypothetical protein
VILVMCGNDDDENNSDLVYNVYHKPRFRQVDRGEPVLTGVPVPLPSRALRLKHSILTHSALAFQLKSTIIDPLRHRRHPRGAIRAKGLGLTLALVDATARVLRDIDARLVVVTTIRYAPSAEFPYDELVEGVRRRGIPVLDIDHSPGYRADMMLIPGDAHWNPAGHRFVAQQLQTMIEDRHLLN